MTISDVHADVRNTARTPGESNAMAPQPARITSGQGRMYRAFLKSLLRLLPTARARVAQV